MYRFNIQKIFLLFFTVFTFNSLLAQSVDIGIRTGINLSSNSFEPELKSITSNGKSGFLGGLFFTFDFGIFSIQSEVLYSQKGSKIESDTNLLNLNREIHINYLEFPILVKYKIPTSKSSQINIFTGPSFGINLNSKYKIDEDGSSYDEDITNQTKATEIGWIFGVGFNLTFNKVKFSIEGRYNSSFSDALYLDDLFYELSNGCFAI
ncbi:MAG: PorT family protein, partial [Ignavibacteriales bacterium]|nr:PorT family protein [Ignavibacteriales bacterium]